MREMIESKPEQAFCSWKDETDSIHSTYVTLLKVTERYVEIETKSSIIIIPMHRLLKLKRKIQNGQ